MPDIVPGDATTTYSLSLGAAVTGTVDTAGDHDWYRINLTAGQTYTFQMWGSGGTPLVDTYLRIYGDTGNLQAGDDDGGPAASSYLSFTASYTGTYYISADGYGSRIGDYTLTAATDGTLPTLTTLQIADYLTGAYWYHTSNGPRAFAGHSVTVDLSGLDDEGQRLARAAMATWEQVCNIDFFETTSVPAQIVFTDDSGLNASTNTNSSGGTITSATIDIGRTWLDTYGTSFDSFSFQTYIYEIGRAIGLGNAGPYTGSYGEATYAHQDYQLYLNDSWAFSVMSYFNREEGGYLGGPQIADIVAAQNLYGTNYRVALGDIDGDGHTDDILWRNGNSGEVATWLTNGADTQTVGLGARSLDWQIAGVGDFDADGGNDDILWYNSTSWSGDYVVVIGRRGHATEWK